MYVIKPNFQGLQSFVQKIPLGQKCYKHTQLATAFYLFYFILSYLILFYGAFAPSPQILPQ